MQTVLQQTKINVFKSEIKLAGVEGAKIGYKETINSQN
jgi:hypothetical protein